MIKPIKFNIKIEGKKSPGIIEFNPDKITEVITDVLGDVNHILYKNRWYELVEGQISKQQLSTHCKNLI